MVKSLIYNLTLKIKLKNNNNSNNQTQKINQLTNK